MRTHFTALLMLVVTLLTIHDVTMAATGHITSAPLAVSSHATHSDAAENVESGDCGMVRLMGRASAAPGDPLPGDQFQPLLADHNGEAIRAISANFLVSPVHHPPNDCRAFFQVFRI